MGRCLGMAAQCFLVLLLHGILSHPSLHAQTVSRVIYDEFADISDEQKAIMTFNYTTLLFTPDKAKPSHTPATFAFDPRSPLRTMVPAEQINPGLNVPSVYDFHMFPANDVLAPLYRHELHTVKVPKKLSAGGPEHGKDPHIVDKEHLQVMLENAFTMPRHSERNSSLADSIGQYIMRKFGQLGLLTGTQPFYPTQFHRFFWETDSVISEGSNIIGIFPGDKYRTKEDKILLVGAHWDTTGFTDGYNDNGSGVAAMIDVARALAMSECKLEYTVIFVAFDKEEVGSQGSHEFVRSYLVPNIFQDSDWPEFQGALIMDTIMNYNTTSGSQLMPDSWLAKTGAREEEEAKGDFISLVSRLGPEKLLADTIETHWNKLADDAQYKAQVYQHPEHFKLRRFEIGLGAEIPSVEELADHIQFLRSDHARFWYTNETDYQLSLRGLLFTDTGPYRGEMQSCYHRECDSKRKYKGEFANYDFLAQTVQTVIDTVSQLSGAHCPGSDRQQRMERYSRGEEEPWQRTTVMELVPTLHYVGGEAGVEGKEGSTEDTESDEADIATEAAVLGESTTAEPGNRTVAVTEDTLSHTVAVTEDTLSHTVAVTEDTLSHTVGAEEVLRSVSSSSPSLASSPLYLAYSISWLPTFTHLIPHSPSAFFPWMG